MFCRYCGKEIEEDSCFCKYCGKNIEKTGYTSKKNHVKKFEDLSFKYRIIIIMVIIYNFTVNLLYKKFNKV